MWGWAKGEDGEGFGLIRGMVNPYHSLLFTRHVLVR
jgi:hypothetical protein